MTNKYESVLIEGFDTTHLSQEDIDFYTNLDKKQLESFRKFLWKAQDEIVEIIKEFDFGLHPVFREALLDKICHKDIQGSTDKTGRNSEEKK